MSRRSFPRGILLHADYIAGIINIRGTVATVVNLAKRFSLSRSNEVDTDKYIILTHIHESLFGVMVDDVTSVMKIPKSALSQSGNHSSTISSEYVESVAVIDDRVILVLDFKTILGDEALVQFAHDQQPNSN
jgi:purine-binding chemotaxis protein CheW